MQVSTIGIMIIAVAVIMFSDPTSLSAAGKGGAGASTTDKDNAEKSCEQSGGIFIDVTDAEGNGTATCDLRGEDGFVQGDDPWGVSCQFQWNVLISCEDFGFVPPGKVRRRPKGMGLKAAPQESQPTQPGLGSGRPRVPGGKGKKGRLLGDAKGHRSQRPAATMDQSLRGGCSISGPI